jgi:hypothetical protein
MANFNWPINPTTVSSGPVSFILDGATAEVTQDTVTPANSIPLPVTSLNPDGTPVDYATETTQLDVLTELQTLNGVDFATEAKQDTQITELQGINTELNTQTTVLGTLATEATLASLSSKVIEADTNNVTVIASALPTGAATEA